MTKTDMAPEGAGFTRQFANSAFAAVLAALLVVLCLGLAGCGSGQASVQSGKVDKLEAADTPAVPEGEGADDEALENPVDFEALQEQNSDVYAWLYVPDTNVNFAVLQNAFADNFYLVHDMYGNESVVGSVYSQFVNSKDFSDPVTLIYAHTFEEWSNLCDEMFGTLHYFEDPEFFANHDKFYVYTPDRILTYKVVSAYEYDDRHIMNSFDFSDEGVRQEYFNYVTNPDSMVKNVREGVTLSADKDKIVQLSTCTRPANDYARYLVTGVLVDERQITS